MTSMPGDDIASRNDAQTGINHRSTDQILARIEEIHTQFQRINPETWNPAEVKVLHRLTHSLAGLAGTLGFFSLCIHACTETGITTGRNITR